MQYLFAIFWLLCKSYKHKYNTIITLDQNSYIMQGCANGDRKNLLKCNKISNKTFKFNGWINKPIAFVGVDTSSVGFVKWNLHVVIYSNLKCIIKYNTCFQTWRFNNKYNQALCHKLILVICGYTLLFIMLYRHRRATCLEFYVD